jgi:hypothetical protein
MKEEEINQLLERYWQCETSIEEERELHSLFSEDLIPEKLKIYQPLFMHIDKLSEVKASAQLKSGINKPVQIQFYPVLKIAASVLIVIALGVGFHTHYQQQKFMDKVFSDTYTDPEEAVKETHNVMARVSSVLQLVQDEQKDSEITDSLQMKKTEHQEKEY